MIQRVQTIFLALAAIASFMVLGQPFATTSQAMASSAIFTDRVFNVEDNIALLVFFAVAGGLAVGALFLFKNRSVQLKLALLALLANAFGVIWAGYLFAEDGNQSVAQIGLGVILPIAAVALHLLARRYIRKDEKLVRSMDRLR